MKKIHFAGPLIDYKDINIVKQSVQDGFYDNYKRYINIFSKNIRSYFNIKYALPTFTCTHAMHLAAMSLDLKRNDEIICPDMSWVATAHALSHHNLKIKFCDIDLDTLCISTESLKKNITKKTKAIMVVHAFGHPANMKEIMKIAKEYNLYVIEDAAPSLGSHIDKKMTGTFGDVGCFSFQGAKIITTNEGGVLITKKKSIYDKARLNSILGRTDSKMMFWSDFIGYRYGMSNLNAALGISQLNKINKAIKLKREIFSIYEKTLTKNNNINFIKEPKYGFSNCAYPNILIKGGNRKIRDKIIKELEKNNIASRAMFPQISSMKMYKHNKSNVNAIIASNTGITLPSPYYLNEKDINRIYKILNSNL
jgi:perosamine synthetase